MSNIPMAIASQVATASIAQGVENVVADSASLNKSRTFDRGLTNYQFIAKNEWICGISASYTGFNSDENDLLLLLKDFNFTGSLFGVDP